MSKSNGWRFAFIIAGLVLLLGPLFVRAVVLGYNRRAYAPAEATAFSAAATPGPTATPLVRPTTVPAEVYELRSGPIVVDFAHGNGVDRYHFEPLAAALANRGLGVRYWMSDIDPMTVTSFLDYPDQSEELTSMLRGASGLVVVSPFFLWSQSEIAVAEQFVADGGRLLLISDPDVAGDLAQDINNLGEPFGVVFAGDYLYDTTENDENHIYVYADAFEDDAESLANSRIAFYGTRSIAGEVTPQVLTSNTALSNLRTGLSGLSAVVKGGLVSQGTQDGVLAMGDFDVLTAPFVERHDNTLLTDYVADFLASGERTRGVIDFPASLGKDVTLVLANAAAVDWQTLEEGSALQHSLEASGRTLSVAGTGYLTQTGETTGTKDTGTVSNDMIVLADYAMAQAETTLLDDLGFTLVEITPTPTVTPTPTNTMPANGTATPLAGSEWSDAGLTPIAPESIGTPSADGTTTDNGDGSMMTTATATEVAPVAPTSSSNARNGRFAFTKALEPARNQPEETPAPLLAPTATFTSTPAPTATPSPTETPSPSATPTVTETPQPEVYLVAEDGLRLVAADTVIISQQQLADGRRVVAVMGYNADGVRSGVDRLLSGGFDGCVTSIDLAVCSDPNGDSAGTDSMGRSAAAEAPAADIEDTPASEPTGKTENLVMVIDDNDLTLPGETSEADIYIKVLAREGYGPTLWTTASDGIPKLADLDGYDWVVWSSGGYESGGPGLADLDTLLSFINSGGSLTISSRRPFFGMSAKEPSVIADVAVDDDLPPMVYGLPSTPISLENGLPPVTPLQIGEEHAGAKIVLLRGPDSSDAGAPLLFVVIDDKGDNPTGARLMIAGMSLTWLPEEYSEQLVRNMTGYMTSD